jgi:hypothetical protein
LLASKNVRKQTPLKIEIGLMNLTGHLVIIKNMLIFIAIYIISESSCQFPLFPLFPLEDPNGLSYSEGNSQQIPGLQERVDFVLDFH